MEARNDGTVAAIIPVYNGERFIRRALDSVFAQTHRPAEIFVIDDGSTDRTLELVAPYGDAVTVISQQNGGPARARNAALEITQAEFIAFLDADDWWEPRKLEMQVAMLSRHPGAVANYTGLRVVREADGVTWDETPIAAEALWPGLRWRNPALPPACVMARRSAVEQAGGFDVRQKGSEDWRLWFKLRQIGPFCVCPEPLTDYRSSPGGLSGNADHMFNDFMQMLDDVLLSGLTGLQRAIWRRRIISYQAFRGSMTARAAGDRGTEKRYMKLSLATWPSPSWEPMRFKACLVTFLRR